MTSNNFILSITWRWPKWIFYLGIIFNILIILFGLIWIFFKFNMPYIHSGDKHIVYILVIFWWILTSCCIWGWKVSDNN